MQSEGVRGRDGERVSVNERGEEGASEEASEERRKGGG